MENRIAWLKKIGVALKWISLFAPLVAVVGWIVNSDTLKRLAIGANAMNPLTAFLFILLALAIIVKHDLPVSPRKWILSIYSLIFLFSLTSLLHKIIGIPVRIDHLFFGTVIGSVNDGVNPMAPATSVLLMIISLAKALQLSKEKAASELLFMMALTLVVFCMTGYAFRVPEFYSSIKLFPALQTCVLFGAVIFAILLAEPDQGVIGSLVIDLEGARIGRTLVIFTIVIPVVIAYLRMLAQWNHLISTEMGVAIVMSSYILVLSASLFVTVASLNKRDKLRKDDALKINELNEELKAINNKQHDLINELATTNEELQATGENLRATNDELLATNEKLEQAVLTIKMQDEIIIRQKEEALKRSQEYLEIIFSNTEEEILLLDSQGKILMYNQALAKFMMRATGKAPKVGTYVWDMTVPERAFNSLQLFQRALTGEVVMEEAPIDIDGEMIVHLLKYEPVWLNNTIKYVTVISVDITNQKETSEQLKDRVDQLQKTNYELDRFVYSVSHDLRAPLSSILGLVNVAEMENSNEKPYLEMIRGRINTLDNFIKNILDYSRNSRTEINRHEIDFEILIEAAKDSLRTMNGFSSMQFEINVKKHSSFYSDALRITTIFNNLFSNAIRFQDRHKSQSILLIEIETTRDQVQMSIRDNGIGIASEHQPKVFNMFYRATDHDVGSGIGLYLVKETVTKLNGSIKMNSILGQYTEFEIILPNGLQS